MKSKIKVAAAQIDCQIGQKQANIDKIKKSIEQICLENPGTELIVFPELTISGYIKIHDINIIKSFIDMAETIPGAITNEIGITAKKYGTYVVFGMPERSDSIPGLIYNTAVLISPDGKLIGKHRKAHIPIEENHYFRGGSEIDVFATDIGNIGLMVCYDTSFPETARTLALKGAEIICSIANWPKYVGEKSIMPTWDHFPHARAAENQLFVIACNRVGKEDNQIFYGRSKIVGPDGSTLAESNGEDEQIITAELDGEQIEIERGFFPFIGNRRPELYAEMTKIY